MECSRLVAHVISFEAHINHTKFTDLRLFPICVKRGSESLKTQSQENRKERKPSPANQTPHTTCM
jgi:hypothetical protein